MDREGTFRRNLAIASNITLIASVVTSAVFFVIATSLIRDDVVLGAIMLVLSAMAAFAISYVIFQNQETRTNTSLVIISLMISIYIINSILMFKDPFSTWIIEKLLNPNFDWRPKYEVIEALKNENLEVFPSIVPRVLLSRQKKSLLPLSGFSNAVTVFCNQSGTYSTYKSDRYGFNNNDDVYDRPGGKILILGDSFAHGFCVNRGDDVASRLRTSGYPAISLGMVANGPMLELASLIEYGAHLKPDLVLWLYFENDISDLTAEARDPVLRKYFEERYSQGLMHRQEEINKLWLQYLHDLKPEEDLDRETGGRKAQLLALAEDFLKLRAIRNLVGITRLHFPKISSEMRRNVKLLGKIVKRANKITADWGAKFVFVYLPSYNHFAVSPSITRDLVISEISRLNVPIIDFQRTLASTGNPRELFLLGHYSVKGYALLANQIREEAIAGIDNTDD